MSYLDDLQDDDEDSSGLGMPTPADSLAGPSTPNPVVMDRIRQVRQGTANDEDDQEGPVGPPAPSPMPAPAPTGGPSPQDLAAMEYAHGVASDTGLGRVANAVASGLGAKVDNTGYDKMAHDANTTANQTMNRSAKVAMAIAQGKARADALAQRAGAKEDAANDKASSKQDAAMQHAIGLLEQNRGSPAVAQAEKDIYAAKKVKSLSGLYGDPNKLNPQMVKMLVSEVAKIAGGGQSSEGELNYLTPSTLTGKLAGAWQSLSNSPTPAHAADFIKQYQDYANSITKDAQETIQDKYGRVIDSSSDLIGDKNVGKLKKTYIDRFKDATQDSGSFPKQVTKGGQTATVSNAQELQEAQAEGFQ